MSKAAIKDIQSGLMALGYDLGKGGADGIEGPLTRAAALAFGTGKSAVPAAPAAPPAPPSNGPMIYQGKARHPATVLALHCSATRPNWMQGKTPAERFAEIRRWHVQENGWSDIGYHYVIDRDGNVLTGRPLNVIGAGIAGFNNGVIHVCLIGGDGSSERDKFSDHFTSAQLISLTSLASDIRSRTQIKQVVGHNQYAAKACPGFNVPSFLKENPL